MRAADARAAPLANPGHVVLHERRSRRPGGARVRAHPLSNQESSAATKVTRWRAMQCRSFGKTDTRCPPVWGSRGALFSALMALALFDPGVASAQEGKQTKPTEKHIQSFMGAYRDMVKLYESANL